MIEFKQGNLLEADVEALVNTVNCVGVMGKGTLFLTYKAKVKLSKIPMQKKGHLGPNMCVYCLSETLIWKVGKKHGVRDRINRDKS